ncbi:hypothetical protein D3C84_837430 [compost metagenome]
MKARYALARCQGHGGAIQGPAQAFDDAHDHMDAGFIDHFSEHGQLRAVQADSALYIAQVLRPAKVTAATDNGAERGAFGVATEKGLGEYRKFTALRSSVTDQSGSFLGTQLWLEGDG